MSGRFKLIFSIIISVVSLAAVAATSEPAEVVVGQG